MAGKILLPFQLITYEFIGHTPDYWCQVGELTNANWTQQQIINFATPVNSQDKNERSCQVYDYNYTEAAEMGYEMAIDNRDLMSTVNESLVNCDSRTFNTSEYTSTLVTEWDLVCDRRALYATTQASSQFGILLGALIFGYFTDRYGRRPILLFCVLLSLLTGLGAALAPVFSLYVILKILVSAFNVGYYNCCFLLMIEVCSPQQRTPVGSLSGIMWSLGYMIVPGIAYVVKPWRWLQVAFSLPMLILFSYYWLLPESPRWLISQGRCEEAFAILTKAAKFNGRSLPHSEAIIASMKKMSTQKQQIPDSSVLRRIVTSLKHFLILIIKSQYRKKILISYFCWCIVSLVYYGVSLNSGNLSTDPYMYVFLGGLAEIPAYFIMWLMLSFMGRRTTLMTCYLVCGFTIAVLGALLFTLEEVPYGLIMTLSLTGKIFITAAFLVNYIITAELFPTRYRSIALGESSMMARVGSIMSPYINDLMGASVAWAPSALFAVLSCLAGGLCLLQPETKDSVVQEDSPSEKRGDQDPQTANDQTKHANVNEGFEIS